MKKKKSTAKKGGHKQVKLKDQVDNLIPKYHEVVSDVFQAVDKYDERNIIDKDKEIYNLMFALANCGVTPEDYEMFYNLHSTVLNAIGDEDVSELKETDVEDDVDFLADLFNDNGFGRFRNRPFKPVKEYSPLKDAKEKTLVLKIGLKNVKKPPMWREITIPADFTFEDLHYAIQAIVGLDDSHLWQFNKSAYDGGVTIGIKSKGYDDFGITDATHDALTTRLTQFFQEKGDKLEYVYDFGDDWIFTVEVKEMLDRKTDYPVCTKFKSELNPSEDMGGIWWYLDTREILANWDTMTKKEKKELVDRSGYFESPGDYYDFLMSCLFDLEETNEQLREITR